MCINKFIRASCGLFFIFLFIFLPGCRWPRRNTVIDSLPSSIDILAVNRTASSKSKPRILIFSCVGGGGHMSAAQAIISYLGNNYEVSIVNIIAEAAGNFDILRFISGNTVGSEDLYNFFLRHGMSRTVGMYCSVGHALTSLCSRYLDARVGEFLDQSNPDLIISVMPFFNGVIYRMAEERHMPFAVVTCDLNTINYIQDLHKPSYKLFTYCIPFEDPYILKAIESASIPRENIKVLGFPVRSSFFVRHNKQELRTAFDLPLEVPVVMILMGAVGGRSVLGYLRKLAKMKTQMHIIACVGRNEALKNCIEHIQFPAHITLSVLGYTDKIAELMQASDLLITKPGPTTICEALYARVPLLLDGTSQPIFWEFMNIDFVLRHQFGEVVTSLRYVPLQVKRLLEDSQQRMRIVQAMEQFDMPDVFTNTKVLVEDLLKQAAT
jgi:processive 1,2-diacylglycerol beta-glucosyltransferase